MSTTIGGVPWLEAKPFGDDGPTYKQWNEDVLAPLGREHGYCMCYHPFDDVIDFDGLGCGFCGQTVTTMSDDRRAEARQLRTDATLAAYPHLRKQGESG